MGKLLASILLCFCSLPFGCSRGADIIYFLTAIVVIDVISYILYGAIIIKAVRDYNNTLGDNSMYSYTVRKSVLWVCLSLSAYYVIMEFYYQYLIIPNFPSFWIPFEFKY
jgi:hypothetical protein